MPEPLGEWAKTLDRGSQAARILVRKKLIHWQVDPDLAGLRERSALDALAAAPNIAISFNGAVIDRISARDKEIERSYDVDARIDAPNELLIETDQTVNPAARGLQNDTRDLGLRLNDIQWSSR